ncbi:MAG: T9SS type A sorting domain-containing protein [Bacteroidota bacterium]
MKKLARLCAILSISIFVVAETSAQCEPDTVNCIDTGDPGQICPQYLPEANVNEPYNEVITVIAPDTASVSNIQIGLAYIVIDSVKGLPDGIEYYTNSIKFYPDSTYCVQIVGTPTEAGDFPLSIYVNAFVDLGTGEPISAGLVVDDTSVVLTVQGPSGIDPYAVHEFQVLPNAPNPFSDVTRLGFFTPFDDHIQLEVYNILGELMHEEMKGSPPGEHYFQFNGSGLLPGTYFYRVTNSNRFYTGKFIKSR